MSPAYVNRAKVQAEGRRLSRAESIHESDPGSRLVHLSEIAS